LTNALRPIRTSAKAIIIQRGYLLMVLHRDALGPWYTLPGGGQCQGETLVEAVQRECREEAGVQVRVGRLRFIREYIGQNHEFKATDADLHQVEFLFECSLQEGSSPVLGDYPDPNQDGMAWLPLHSLPATRIYPAILAHVLNEDRTVQGPVYLGDVN
jgi:8-oxo-dGTP pyrophosphatase MutT (NUDIX family)